MDFAIRDCHITGITGHKMWRYPHCVIYMRELTWCSVRAAALITLQATPRWGRPGPSGSPRRRMCTKKEDKTIIHSGPASDHIQVVSVLSYLWGHSSKMYTQCSQDLYDDFPRWFWKTQTIISWNIRNKKYLLLNKNYLSIKTKVTPNCHDWDLWAFSHYVDLGTRLCFFIRPCFWWNWAIPTVISRGTKMVIWRNENHPEKLATFPSLQGQR